MTETKTRETYMRQLREFDVPDDLIGELFGMSRQRVHQILGAKPPDPPLPASAKAPLSAAVAAFRRRHKLSLAATAKVLGVSLMTVHNWEKGKNPGMPGVILLALEALDNKMETKQ